MVEKYSDLTSANFYLKNQDLFTIIGLTAIPSQNTELPVDPKFRAKTRIRAKWLKLPKKGPNFSILARFKKKNGYIFFFNSSSARMSI